MQYSTQFYGRRPYGVGMLIAGYDVSTCIYVCMINHLFLLSPSLYIFIPLFLSSYKVLIYIRPVHPLIIMIVSVWPLVLDHSLPGHILRENLTTSLMVRERGGSEI